MQMGNNTLKTGNVLLLLECWCALQAMPVQKFSVLFIDVLILPMHPNTLTVLQSKELLTA